MRLGLGLGAITPRVDPALLSGFSLSNAVVSSMGTAGPLDNMSPDGFTWAQGDAIKVDRFGKIITLAQDNTGNKDIDFVYSNDGGATWSSTALSQGFITRGNFALDETNDIVHVLWLATATSDGMIYRRYNISRDGSNNITGLTRDTNINLQLDTNADQYEHPVLIYCDDAGFGANGALLAIWSVRNAAGSPQVWEIRASMRVLSNTVADNTAGNWAPAVTDSATSITQDASVPYSIVSNGSTNTCPRTSAARKASGTNALDVYVCWHEGSDSAPLRMRRMQWNSSNNDWSTGLSSTTTILSTLQRGGTDGGYGFKHELLTQPVFAGDTVWLGFANWKDNTDGDTWSVIPLTASGTAGSIIDVYSAGGAHSFAPTGDIAYDATSGHLIVSYLTSDASQNNNRVQLVTYESGVLGQGPISFTSSENADIPLLYNGRYGSKLLLIWRDAMNSPSPPYQGYYATVDIS